MAAPFEIRALLVDAGGTLLRVREPVAATYARVARAHGHPVELDAVEAGFQRAFSTPWLGLRYAGDGLSYWRHVVATALGVDDNAVLHELYDHFRHPAAWTVAPGARACLGACQRAGIRTALVSNWDLRLRPLIEALELEPLLDVLAISAEIGSEKPEPALVHHALAGLGVAPGQAVLVGDSSEDVRAAAAAGCACWHMPDDVAGFAAVQARILGG